MKSYFTFICLLVLVSSVDINFDDLVEKSKNRGKLKKVAVSGGDNEEQLRACRQLKDLKIADSILVGDKEKIIATAKKENVNIDDFEIVDLKDDTEICRMSAKLVHDKKADILIKGSSKSNCYLKGLLDKKVGLRDGKLVHVISVLEIKKMNKVILTTDGAVVPKPTLAQKADMIRNAVHLARALGFEKPKVAPLTCVETVNPKMPETVEAKELTEMYKRGEIKDCIVDGPLSFDLAIDPEAAKLKKIHDREIFGDADILLAPDIHAGNILYKLITHLTEGRYGSLITGVTAPCIMTSRGDSVETRINGVALSVLYSEYLEGK